VKLFECKRHLGTECRLAYGSRLTYTECTESWLLRNGKIVDIAFLNNCKKYDQVVLEDIGAVFGGGVASKHSIRIGYQSGFAR